MYFKDEHNTYYYRTKADQIFIFLDELGWVHSYIHTLVILKPVPIKALKLDSIPLF